MLLHIFVVFLMMTLMVTRAEYPCYCVFDNYVHPIYQEPNVTANIIGFLPPNQCKYFLYPENAQFVAIMVFHQKGFIHLKTQGIMNTCEGNPLSSDIFIGPNTTVTETPSTGDANHPESSSTSSVETTSSFSSTTSTAYTTSTSPSTSTVISSTNTSIHTSSNKPGTPEGHIEACPDNIKNTDMNHFHGFLGKFGDFCYKLVDTPTQWGNAERHCALESQGHLVHVQNKDEQDFLLRFLNKHHYMKGVWLGLTDSGDNYVSEGKWRWISGVSFSYNNFQGDYAQHSSDTHKYSDCVLFRQGGEWTDVSCGTSLAFGVGFGETHPYICQYNISSTLPSILDALPNVVIGR